MEEQTQITPIETPETVGVPETTPFDPTVAEPVAEPSGEPEAAATPPVVAEAEPSTNGKAGIITPLAVPMDGGVGDVAAIPCIIDPLGHGYIVMRVPIADDEPVVITHVPEGCQAEHPLDDTLATEYAIRARSVASISASTRKQGVAVSPVPTGPVPPQAAAEMATVED